MYQCIAENYWGIKYANAELRVIGKCFTHTAVNLTSTTYKRLPPCSPCSLCSYLWVQPHKEAAAGSQERSGGDRVQTSSGPQTSLHVDEGQRAALQQLTVSVCETRVDAQDTGKKKLILFFQTFSGFQSCTMELWRSSTPPSTMRERTPAPPRTTKGRPAALDTSPPQVGVNQQHTYIFRDVRYELYAEIWYCPNT